MDSVTEMKLSRQRVDQISGTIKKSPLSEVCVKIGNEKSAIITLLWSSSDLSGAF